MNEVGFMIRKIAFISIAILVFITSGFGISRSFAKTRLTDFEEMDTYISAKMKELEFLAQCLSLCRAIKQKFGCWDTCSGKA